MQVVTITLEKNCLPCCQGCPDVDQTITLTISGLTWCLGACVPSIENNINMLLDGAALPEYMPVLANIGPLWEFQYDETLTGEYTLSGFMFLSENTDCSGVGFLRNGVIFYRASCSAGILTIDITFEPSSGQTFRIFKGSGSISGTITNEATGIGDCGTDGYIAYGGNITATSP